MRKRVRTCTQRAANGRVPSMDFRPADLVVRLLAESLERSVGVHQSLAANGGI